VSVSEWREVRIGDIGDVVTGKTPSSKNPEYFGDEIPFVTPTDYKNYHKNIYSSERYLSQAGKEVLGNKLLPINSVIVTCIGSDMGKVAINKVECITNQQINSIILKRDLADSDFIYYTLISMQEYLKMLARGGTTMPIVNKSTFEEIKLLLPPFPEQKAIAATLSALDDMIELNNQINKTLEEMAQAIFKSWFVDFEPFKDGEFEESELGLIPKGWRVGAIDELIKETISGDWGKETPQGNYTEKVICIRGADIPDIAQGRRGNPATRYILKRNLEKKRLSENEIIIEISGGSPTQSTGRTVFITKELINSFQEPIICTNFCRTVRLKEATYSSFVYSLLQYLYNEKVFFTYENGTTGIKNLDITTLFGQYKTVIPSEEVFAEYHSMYSEFLRYIYESGFECKKLSEIRDTLLPKLISGEIRVPVEEVV
jgi:type I restriction enzyme S subunit